jgi:DNA-directed RNA polymerase specialized sigma24 family protein
MMTANKLSHPEIREKVTSSILHLLATLPEAHKNIFVWKHYYGWPEPQIASRLGCSPSDVENTLQEIRRTLIQRTEAIMLESGSLGETSQPQGMCATCCA